MARIIEKPEEKRVKCNTCGAVIGYVEDEVTTTRSRDYDGGTCVTKTVKCPRRSCSGYGIVSSY